MAATGGPPHIPATVRLRMSGPALALLCNDYGWDAAELEVDTDDAGGVLVTVHYDEGACPAADVLEGARHCVNTLARRRDELIEIA